MCGCCLAPPEGPPRNPSGGPAAPRPPVQHPGRCQFLVPRIVPCRGPVGEAPTSVVPQIVPCRGPVEKAPTSVVPRNVPRRGTRGNAQKIVVPRIVSQHGTGRKAQTTVVTWIVPCLATICNATAVDQRPGRVPSAPWGAARMGDAGAPGLLIKWESLLPLWGLPERRTLRPRLSS